MLSIPRVEPDEEPKLTVIESAVVLVFKEAATVAFSKLATACEAVVAVFVTVPLTLNAALEILSVSVPAAFVKETPP